VAVLAIISIVVFVTPIVMAIVSIVITMGMVSLESFIVPLTIVVVAIPFTEMTIMLVRVVTPTSFRRMVLLVKRLGVVLAIAELPLAVLFLLDVIVQGDGLIKQGLVVGCIVYRQWNLHFNF
jgi:hypothetical protein